MDYPLDVTEEEQELGFQVIQLENPGNSISDFSFRPVVGYVVSNSDVVIKNTDPFTKSICYKQMRWGTLREDGYRGRVSEWHPVGNVIYSQPAEAIQNATVDLDDDQSLKIIAKPFVRTSA